MTNKSKNKDIKAIAKNSDSIEIFAKNYINYLSERFFTIDFSKFEKLKNFILKARNQKKTIFIFGNGGSAATASTMANDLGFVILKKTPDETNIVLDFPKQPGKTSSGIVLPADIPQSLQDRAGNIVKELKSQNLIS